MTDTDMTVEEREAFLAAKHVGMLSIARQNKGPLALPIWYLFRGDDVVFSMNGTSPKADLLRKSRRATLTAQREEPPCQYVMVEGPVTVNYENFDIAELAIRYI